MESYHTIDSEDVKELNVRNRLARDTYTTHNPYKAKSWYFSNKKLAKELQAEWQDCSMVKLHESTNLPKACFAIRISM